MEGRTETHDKTVWPPPPSGAVSLAAWFPFRFLNLRVQGETSDFRTGWIGLEPTGITIHGKVVTRFPGTLYVWGVFILARHWMPHRFGLFVPEAVVVAALLSNLFRKTRKLTVPWSQVRQIVLDQEKYRAGIVYDAPDKVGKIKTYSLVFALKPALYPSFASAAEQYAPECSLDDKLRGESLAPLLVLPLHIRFQVRAGEILGMAGVSGNGQQELMAALSGEDPRAPRDSLRLFGRDVARADPRTRRARGLHFIPEERLGRGAVPTLSLADNTLLTRTEAVSRAGWIDTRRVTALAAQLLGRFNVKAGGPGAAAKSLSGGNLQKFIVGREIDAKPKLLIVCQPTWGVDVGAATQIRGELLALRDAGCALLVVSEELDELFEICDRLVVIARGRVSPSVATGAATVETIGEWMSGLWPANADREVADAAA